MPNEKAQPEAAHGQENTEQLATETTPETPTEATPAAETANPEAAEVTLSTAQPAAEEATPVEPAKTVELAAPAAAIPQPATAWRLECKRFVDAFGAVNGAQWFTDGLTFEAATAEHAKALTAENALLKGKLQAAGMGMAEPLTVTPVAAEDGADEKAANVAKFEKVLDSPNLAKVAAGMKMAPAKK